MRRWYKLKMYISPGERMKVLSNLRKDELVPAVGEALARVGIADALLDGMTLTEVSMVPAHAETHTFPTRGQEAGGGSWIKTPAGAEHFARNLPEGYTLTAAKAYQAAMVRQSRPDFVIADWDDLGPHRQTMAINSINELLGFLVSTGWRYGPAG